MNAADGIWHGLFEGAFDLLYPRRCSLCGLLNDENPCQTCVAELVPNQPFAWYEADGPLSFRAALYSYAGRGGQAVRRLKYARSTSLENFMSREIAKAIDELGSFDVVVPVPIHWTRRCWRGFNQAELLVAKVKAEPQALTRVRATKPQVGLNREQRLRNLAGAFRASPIVRGKSLLLVDDVVTSGQTARECAGALMSAGAREVGILAFCGEPMAD